MFKDGEERMFNGWVSFEQIVKDDRGKLKFLIPELNKAGHKDNSKLWCECIINFDPEGRPPDSEYNEYLESQHWQDVRKEALREYTECLLCGYTSDYLEVHHVRYTTLGREDVDNDLIVLCDDCHNLLHSLYIDMQEYLATMQNFLTDTGEFRVGKHKGRRVGDVAIYDKSYLAWVYRKVKSRSDRKQLARYLDPFDM